MDALTTEEAETRLLIHGVVLELLVAHLAAAMDEDVAERFLDVLKEAFGSLSTADTQGVVTDERMRRILAGMTDDGGRFTERCRRLSERVREQRAIFRRPH